MTDLAKVILLTQKNSSKEDKKIATRKTKTASSRIAPLRDRGEKRTRLKTGIHPQRAERKLRKTRIERKGRPERLKHWVLSTVHTNCVLLLKMSASCSMWGDEKNTKRHLVGGGNRARKKGER